MNGNDTFLDVNDAHLRVTSGNVYASAFNLDQIDIVMSSNTASTVNFNNPAKAFNAASNIEVGTANLFVDTTTTRVGVGTASPATTLDVAGDLNVSGNLTIIGTTTTLDTDHLRVKDPIIELGKDNTASPVVDLGLVMTRPSGSSNVGIIFDESATTLEIGYTQGSASDSTITMDSAPLSVNVNGTISGNGSGLTALNAANITAGTLAVSRGGTGTTTSTGTGSVVLSNAPTFTGDSAFLHTGFGTPHNSNDITLRLGGLNSSGNIIQSKCAIIVSPNTSYGGEADYGRNAIHFCTRNTQDNTNADITNAKISILPNGNVGFSHPNPDKRIHVRTFSNSILAGLDHVTTSGSSGNDEYVGLGFGATSGSQSNRIFKGGIFFNRKGGDTGRGDLLFCIENTQDNSTEVSPANTIMKITRNSDVSITGGFSVSGNATFDTDTLHVDATNDRVGIGTTDPQYRLDVGNGGGDVMLRVMHQAASSGKLIFGRSGDTEIRSHAIESYNSSGSQNNYMKFLVHDGTGTSPYETRTEVMTLLGNGNVGIGTTSPIAALDIDGGPENDTVPALSIRGGLYSESDLYVLNTYNDSTVGGVGYAAKVIGVNIKNKVETNNTVKIRSNSGGLTCGSAMYLGSDDSISGVFGILTGDGVVGTTLTEKLTVRASGNVGIGTNNPATKLHVEHSGSAIGDFEGIRIANHATLLHATVRPAYEFVVSDIAAGTGIGNGKFAIGYRGTTSASRTDRLVIDASGNVGINQISPTSKLHIKPNHTSYSNPGATSGVVIYNETNSDAGVTHAILNLRTGGSSGGDPFISYDVYGEHGWSVGIDNSAGRQLRFGESWANFSSTRAYISPGSTANEIDFTGQHRSFIDTIAHTDYLKYEGLIVSANKNQYFDIQEEIVTGVQAIKINESLPLVSISNVAYDKCCFGVISGSEDTNDREYSQGSFVSVLKKQDGDIRAHVNSVGEGAIWVVNTNGILESGDYITTSNVAGYGQKQDSEFLANYTVAKITMDCDFNPSTQPTRIIKRELRDVNYWVKYTYDDISEEEYTRVKNLGRRVRIIEGGTEISREEYENHLKKEGYTETESTYIRNETTHQRVFSDKKMEPTDGFNLEVRNEPVNVLDEHGQIQWEDDPSGATEKAYKIRYLDADGNITDEANHVHKAAFVGCTYHCG